MSEHEEYLGDGLYTSFDGYQIRLRAPRSEGDHEVFLEASTLKGVPRVYRHTAEDRALIAAVANEAAGAARRLFL